MPIVLPGRFFTVEKCLLATLCAAGILFAASAPAQQPSSAAPAAPKAPAPAARGAGPAAATHKTAPGGGLTTDKQKASYALGTSIGHDLSDRKLDLSLIDSASLALGLRDALGGGKLALTDDQIKAALTQLQGLAAAKQQAAMKTLGEGNLKEGQEFLANNKTKEGVVALPSGLQYKILTAGTGAKPGPTDTVVCDYRGTLINGKEFDSSYKRGAPASFPVNRVIKGWTEALQLMPVGSKWQLFIPPDLAYGASGAGRDIGPNATLIFEVELHSIQGR